MTEEYIKARKAGEKYCRKRIADGKYPYLPALDDICPGCDIMPQKSLGVMEIPVRYVSGTKTRARQNSFASNFMPVLEPGTEFAGKWASLYKAQISEGFNDPIKAYEYLHRFYVQEGNKRVSVSKFLDMPTIAANVVRIMPEKKVLSDNPAYAAFLKFFNVCGIYDIEFTNAESYSELAELMGQDLKTPWCEDTIKTLQAAYWYFSKVYEHIYGDRSGLPASDAFLIYLRVFIKDALRSYSPKIVEKRIDRIKNEFLKEKSAEKVALIEEAGEALNAGSVITKTGTAVSRVIPAFNYSPKHPLKAAFIYDKLAKDSTWISDHERGRERLERAYGGSVLTKSYENCLNAELFEKAVRNALGWGAEVIFTAAPVQINDALRAAIEHKNVNFLNCSVNLAHHAVRTYYAKLYEAKFLEGIVAGVFSASDGTHKIGYVSDFPIYGTVADINAFAIGAAMTDPEARIYLDWSVREGNNWWWDMVDRGIHVLSAIDSAHNSDGSDAYGLCYVERCADGEGNDLSRSCRIRNLAVPFRKWGKLYEIIIKTIMDGTYHSRPVDVKDRATNYWWGMISGVVDISLSDDVSAYTRRLVETLKSDIIDGRLNPFSSELVSQDGIVRHAWDKELSSKDIIQMDWLNENIVGEIPTINNLREDAKETVRFSGVSKSKGEEL